MYTTCLGYGSLIRPDSNTSVTAGGWVVVHLEISHIIAESKSCTLEANSSNAQIRDSALGKGKTLVIILRFYKK